MDVGDETELAFEPVEPVTFDSVQGLEGHMFVALLVERFVDHTETTRAQHATDEVSTSDQLP